jgi:hypothetical protein
MKIAYITTYDALDITNWSGTGYYIAKALEKNTGVTLKYIGNLEILKSTRLNCQKQFYNKILSKGYQLNRHPSVLKYYAMQVQQALATIDYDIAFSPGTIPISHLDVQKPIVTWTDATFGGMVDFYPAYCNLSRTSIRNGHRMEQLALTRCSLAIYGSEWAAETAADHYEVDRSKIRVVPFGATLRECDQRIVLNACSRIAATISATYYFVGLIGIGKVAI